MTYDFTAHNEEVQQVMDSYHAGDPIRTPVLFSHNPRFTMWMPEVNTRRIEFKQYVMDPMVMIDRQLEHFHWALHHIRHDVQMGLPDAWTVYVDFQNTYDAAWYGCPVRFRPGQVPDTEPILTDDNKRMLFDKGLPDPFGGEWMERNWQYYELFTQLKEQGWRYADRPIGAVVPTAMGTDGPVTVCCNLRGATEFMTDLLDDPEYAEELLHYVTEASIARIRAYRKRLGQPELAATFGLADDSIELLSLSMYREVIAPYHRRLKEALAEPGCTSFVHLCGDVQRLLPAVRDELNVASFDTGFPLDHGRLRRELGPDVEVWGGPSVPILQHATPDECFREAARILHSGILEGKRFILREGNNLAPNTPLDNLNAVYEAAKTAGRYRLN